MNVLITTIMTHSLETAEFCVNSVSVFGIGILALAEKATRATATIKND